MPQPFRAHTGRVAPLDRPNVDTDQIVPKQFLKRIERTGYGQFLFYDWARTPEGKPNAEFVLNQPRYRAATILVTGRNFGCGSSREHAPWALADYGFRVLIAPSFADIFATNCFKNGLLTVELREEAVALLIQRAAETADYHLTVDLERCRLSDAQGLREEFSMDPFRRDCLLNGLDEIGLTLRHESSITEFESRRSPASPSGGASGSDSSRARMKPM